MGIKKGQKRKTARRAYKKTKLPAPKTKGVWKMMTDAEIWAENPTLKKSKLQMKAEAKRKKRNLQKRK